MGAAPLAGAALAARRPAAPPGLPRPAGRPRHQGGAAPARGAAPAGAGRAAAACAASASGLLPAAARAARRRRPRRGGGVLRGAQAGGAAAQGRAPPGSWEELQEEFLRPSSSGEAALEAVRRREAGLSPHADADVRYFGESRAEPRVTLYRDSAAWCPDCQKVWLLLEAKRIDYRVRKISMPSYGQRPREFLDAVPGGSLPAVEIDGRLVTDSRDIMFELERVFMDPKMPMFPLSNPEREWALCALEVEREFIDKFSNFLFRPTDPVSQMNSGSVGVVLGYLDQQLGRTVTWSNLERQTIEDAPWFLDYDHPTLVDFSIAPHIERAVACGLYYKGYDIRDTFPNINAWLNALEKLPYYMATKGDFYTHCMSIASPQNSPVPDNEALPKRVRSLLDPATARLPVQRSAEPEPWSGGQLANPESVHTAEAAVQILRNHAAIVRFCCRADGGDVGRWAQDGLFRSELADPLAEPGGDLEGAVDVLLLYVAAALIRRDADLVRGGVRSAAAEARLSSEVRLRVARCLAYLRDRVSVPRDMQMPAAKLLRAYLGEAVLALAGNSV